MEYSVLIIFVLAILIWVYFDKSKNSTKDFTKTEIKPVKARPDFLHDPDKQPTIDQVEAFLEPEVLKLFKAVIEHFEDLGTPQLLWRGPENGWVLGLNEDETCGSVILAKDKLIGQSSFRSSSISISGSFSAEVDFNQFELANKSDIIEFYDQVKHNFLANL